MDFLPLERFLNHLTDWRMPGNSVIVSVCGKNVFEYSSGYADIESKEPFSPDKLISIYSCSKVLTVSAALQLFEKGLLCLDAPLYDYIPAYENVLVSSGGELRKPTRPITVRNLFTMTSGLQYRTKIPAIEKARKLTNGKMDTLTVIECLAEQPLAFDPGDRFCYSLSHDVLAAVVEVISGKKFRDYVKENIFAPLGMTNSMYHNEAVRDQMAQLYCFVDGDETDIVKMQKGNAKDIGGKIEKVSRDNDLILGPEYDSGGAGITTTVRDYSKLCAALSMGGISENGERILKPETVDLLQTRQLSNTAQKSFREWFGIPGYSYGLGVRTLVDSKAAGTVNNGTEFGWGGAAGANVLVDTKNKLSVFYAHHMLNPQENYYQPRLRDAIYESIKA